MFVEKYNHALSRDEIKRSLWDDESGTENRLSNLLSTLRNALKDYPEYQIMVDEEKGYILKIRKHTTDGNQS
jgi:DNA-binding winged helix-turn-helix (wHTH) protein